MTTVIAIRFLSGLLFCGVIFALLVWLSPRRLPTDKNTVVQPAPTTRLQRYILYFLILAAAGAVLKICDGIR